MELNNFLLEYKKQTIFTISKEEARVRILMEGIKERIRGNLLEEKQIDYILLVVSNLLEVNYIKNSFNNKISIKYANENLEKLQENIFKILFTIELNQKKFDLMNINYFVNFIKKLDFNLIIILIITIVAVILYYFWQSNVYWCWYMYKNNKLYNLKNLGCRVVNNSSYFKRVSNQIRYIT